MARHKPGNSGQVPQCQFILESRDGRHVSVQIAYDWLAGNGKPSLYQKAQGDVVEHSETKSGRILGGEYGGKRHVAEHGTAKVYITTLP
ncbi:hypothetical protein FRC08_010123 [Ceratobasidium sp. 394]|nr:hypothetical protein FRC08_010123 [Ceratobasidium sp. 394]